MKKLTSLLLALFVVAQFAVPAFAADTSSATINDAALSAISAPAAVDLPAALAGGDTTQATVSMLRIGSTIVMYDNVLYAAPPKGTAYNHNTKTLTLSSYSGGGIYSQLINLKVELKGKNKVGTFVDSNVARGVMSFGGTLTFGGTGTLTFNSKVSGSDIIAAIVATKGITLNGGKLDLTSTGSSLVVGMMTDQGSIRINANKGASVKIYANTSKGGEAAILSRSISVGTNAKTLIRQGTSPSSSVAAKSIATHKEYIASMRANYSITNSKFVSVTGVIIPVNPTKVSVAKTRTLAVGKTITLATTVSPSTATNKSVTFSSSRKSVATVNASGVVRGLSKGQTVITVKTKVGGKTAKCTVTVK